jgi:hypothetical protein
MVIMKDQGAEQVSVDSLDAIFRPYMHWVNDAQSNKVHPDLARNTLVNLISLMIMEMASRMSGREDDGSKAPIEVWLGEFMISMRDELIHDMELNRENIRSH